VDYEGALKVFGEAAVGAGVNVGFEGYLNIMWVVSLLEWDMLG
jgi:hypothetical protein